jgi:hypothetical protein
MTCLSQASGTHLCGTHIGGSHLLVIGKSYMPDIYDPFSSKRVLWEELGFCVIPIWKLPDNHLSKKKKKFPDNQTGENGDEQTDEKMANFSWRQVLSPYYWRFSPHRHPRSLSLSLCLVTEKNEAREMKFQILNLDILFFSNKT